MIDRLKLHSMLEGILGSSNVYFQPPSGYKMKYPAIRYSMDNVLMRSANNKKYFKDKGYSLVIISQDPDSDIVDRVLEEIPKSRFDRFYSSDNLNHWTVSIY